MLSSLSLIDKLVVVVDPMVLSLGGMSCGTLGWRIDLSFGTTLARPQVGMSWDIPYPTCRDGAGCASCSMGKTGQSCPMEFKILVNLISYFMPKDSELYTHQK